MEEEYETYEEVETENTSSFTFEDGVFCLGGLIILCFIFSFTLKQVKSSFKNMHLKIGDKIEIGLETKEDNSEIQNTK